MSRSALLPLTLSFAIYAAPALAQDMADDADSDELLSQGSDIVVIGGQLAGQIDAPQKPIMVLQSEDIAAYGATSLGDLVAALAPQTGSGRGRGGGHPVILFNGQRIGNFREFRNIPPEAVRRMEILPEEVALRFGYQPNQRVMNFILRDKFASKAVDMEYNIPTHGGFGESEIEATLLKIDKASRLNLNIQAENSTMLTEDERGVIQSQPAFPDPAAYRSLIADSRDLTLNGSWSTGLGKEGRNGSLALNGSIKRSDSRSLSGFNLIELNTANRPDFDNALTRISRTVTTAGGAALNKALGTWQLSTTLDASLAHTETDIDRRAAAGFDRLNTRNTSMSSLATLTGRPFRVPAGDATLTVKGGYGYTAIRSQDTRSVAGIVNLARNDMSAGFNLALPLTSRRDDVLAAMGDLSLNFSGGISELSDFGTLTDWSAGLSWSPTEKLGLQASYIVNQAAPSLTDLGNPLAQTFNVAIYDFATGQTALVTILSGGNPALVREKQRDLKLSANWTLPFPANSSLLVEYFRNRSDNVTASFPLLTPAIEAAFPTRAVRDGDGNLLSIDRRPITLAQTEGQRIRLGFNISGTLGKPTGPSNPTMAGAGGPPRMGPPPGSPGGPGGGPRGRGPGGGGPMMAMMGGGNGQGRWNLSLFHTIRFSEIVHVSAAGPVLDLLGGDALSGGGVARHSLELEGGTFYRGFGLRFNGNWAAPTHLTASGAPGTTDLRFGSVFRLDIRTFVNFSQQKKLIETLPFLKGAQLAFQFDNIFDSRQNVTDSAGIVPLSYQPDYLDPRGRMIGVDFRKVF